MSNVFNNKESKVLLLNLQLLEVLGKGKVNEALILQQIDYWTTINKKKNELFIDNEYWLFSSVNQMYERDFKFCFGVDTLKRALVKLEKDGYIITQKHKNGKLYRVNYQKIDEVYNLKIDKNINIVENKLTSHLLKAFRKYEPRASLKQTRIIMKDTYNNDFDIELGIEVVNIE